MPNNGIISRQAVIQSEFLVESADPTDLVIINTPTTGNKVQQKAVPVSALGAAPYFSFVYRLHLLTNLSDASERVYNSFPVEYDLGVIADINGLNDPVSFSITDGNQALDFRDVNIVIDSFPSNLIRVKYKEGSEVLIEIPNVGGGLGAQFLIDNYVIFEIKYYY